MKDQAYFSVCDTLATHLDVHPAEIRPEQNLRTEWGLDDIELNVIALRLEEREDIEIRVRDLETLHTVGQLMALVRAIGRRKELREDRFEAWVAGDRR